MTPDQKRIADIRHWIDGFGDGDDFHMCACALMAKRGGTSSGEPTDWDYYYVIARALDSIAPLPAPTGVKP